MSTAHLASALRLHGFYAVILSEQSESKDLVRKAICYRRWDASSDSEPSMCGKVWVESMCIYRTFSKRFALARVQNRREMGHKNKNTIAFCDGVFVFMVHLQGFEPGTH